MPGAKQLTIVVPYRDRQAHLRQFLPHLRRFFAAHDVIPYHIVIVEQEAGLAFNRGALKNIGFRLGGRSDYTCFHDVDFLPVAADYGWTDIPTGLVWVGAEAIPITAAPDTHYITPNMQNFFGGAFLIPNALFERVNGFSNDYWGWGYEDTDILIRFERAQIPLGRRRGTFLPLFHESEGYEANGEMKMIGRSNRALIRRKWAIPEQGGQDGLSTLNYEILDRENIPDPSGHPNGNCERILVRLAAPAG